MIDRFFVCVFANCTFLNEKKSVTNTFRGDEFRPKTRAGGSPSNLAGLSRTRRVEITRGFIERTRRRAGASFARRSKAEGNARVFARGETSRIVGKKVPFSVASAFFFDIFWDIFYGTEAKNPFVQGLLFWTPL